MIIRLICGVIFGVLAAIATQAADGQLRDDDRVPPYNYNLVGVTSVVYGQVPNDRLFLDNDNDCKIDWNGWYTAIDLVANQSNKLKFIKFAAHGKRSRELWAKRDELFEEYQKEFFKVQAIATQKTERCLPGHSEWSDETVNE